MPETRNTNACDRAVAQIRRVTSMGMCLFNALTDGAQKNGGLYLRFAIWCR
jgi:hypothetical protein